ncbi:hypothetical protein TNCV_3874321 [Trichonephila clavipes]|nr:hypothetical protein TNCV_3874321 [Trichonephila clavipes]
MSDTRCLIYALPTAAPYSDWFHISSFAYACMYEHSCSHQDNPFYAIMLNLLNFRAANRGLTHSLLSTQIPVLLLQFSVPSKANLDFFRRNHEDPPMLLTSPLCHPSLPIRFLQPNFSQENTFSIQTIHIQSADIHWCAKLKQQVGFSP